MQTIKRMLLLIIMGIFVIGAGASNFDILDLLPGILGKKGYSLQVSGVPAGTGGVNVSPAQARYAPGAKVTLTPSPASGYAFVNWTGDLTGTANPAIITMDKNKKIQAVFANAPILQVPSLNGSLITLTWTFNGWPQLVASNEGYRLEESTSSASGPFTEIAQIQGRASPKSQPITRNPGTYYYRVRVFINQMGIGYSPYSNVVSATVAAQARQITIINNVGSQVLNEVVQVKVVPADGTKYSKSNDLLWPDTPTCWNLPEDNIGPGSSKTFNIPVAPPYYIFIGMGVWEPGSIYIGCPGQWFKRRQATDTSFNYYYIWRQVRVDTHTGNWNWTISGSYTSQQGLFVTPAGINSFIFQATTYDPIP